MVFNNWGIISSSDCNSLDNVEIHFSKYLILRINTSMASDWMGMHLDRIMGGREKFFVSPKEKTGYWRRWLESVGRYDMYGWDLDDYTCTLKCMCLLDYIQCQLSMRISAKESRTRVACLDSCCHGLGLVDIDEITFLSKLVYPSMRILNLGKKEKRKSI